PEALARRGFRHAARRRHVGEGGRRTERGGRGRYALVVRGGGFVRAPAAPAQRDRQNDESTEGAAAAVDRLVTAAPFGRAADQGRFPHAVQDTWPLVCTVHTSRTLLSTR